MDVNQPREPQFRLLLAMRLRLQVLQHRPSALPTIQLWQTFRLQGQTSAGILQQQEVLHWLLQPPFQPGLIMQARHPAPVNHQLVWQLLLLSTTLRLRQEPRLNISVRLTIRQLLH